VVKYPSRSIDTTPIPVPELLTTLILVRYCQVIRLLIMSSKRVQKVLAVAVPVVAEAGHVSHEGDPTDQSSGATPVEQVISVTVVEASQVAGVADVVPEPAGVDADAVGDDPAAQP
jgi:hypothetical protein